MSEETTRFDSEKTTKGERTKGRGREGRTGGARDAVRTAGCREEAREERERFRECVQRA